MKIGLFFGSFNPIHNGHIAIARHMVEHGTIDILWFVVSPQNPFKDKEDLLDDDLRFEMVRLAIEDDNRFEASNIEFGLPQPSYTVNTLQYLQNQYPDIEFKLIMGSDNFVNLAKWKDYKKIIDNYSFLIYPRPDFNADSQQLEGNFTIIKAPLLDISSTSIRLAVSEGRDISNMVPEPVDQFIKAKGLYQHFFLSINEQKHLLELARETIIHWLDHKQFKSLNKEAFSEKLKTPCGAFVTLHKKGNLRGCIGRFGNKEPLINVIQDMAVSAACNDYRFDPVTKDEIKQIDIEISVLTPLKPISGIDEFILGKHGIYIKKDYRSGTFLPQVALDTNWDKEEFLGHCARDKAGIGWFGWKDAELFTYEALVFRENDFIL